MFRSVRQEDGCPECYGMLGVRTNCFFWRGNYFSGLVCVPCNILYDNPEDSFMQAVARSSGASRKTEGVGGSRSL